jgi:hypothetical protein
MATVNVTTANTFEEWRVKTNELGTATGNLTDLTEPKAGATNIIAALEDHEARTEALDAIVGTEALWDASGTYDTIREAVNKNHSDIGVIAATAGISLAGSALSGYNGSETTLVAILNAQRAVDIASDADIASNDTDIAAINTKLGTISAVGMGTTASTVGPAILELHGELTTATTNIAALGTTYVAVAGDTMTGKLITASSGLGGSNAGVSAATLLTLGTGSGTAIKIDANQRIGVGTTAHATHKVDVSGNLNATTLSYAGTDLETLYSSVEEIQDIVGAMVTSNTESGGIAVTYEDGDGTLDFVISDDGHNHTTGQVDDLAEFVQDTVGAMVSSNTESGIAVTYDDGDGTLDFDVNDPTITLTGAVTGSGTITNLGSVSIATTSGVGNVITADIADDAVTAAKIADNAIDSNHYIDGSIDNEHIADDAINSEHYAAASIDNEHLADDAVDSDEIAAGAIDLVHMSVNSVDSDQYVDGSIDAAHLSASLGDLRRGVTHVGRDTNDHIAIGTTAHDFVLDGAIDMRLENDGDLHVEGDVIAYSTTISDATLKYNINPVEFALDKIKQLKGVTFNYLKGDKKSAGLLAQDVEKIMPSAVRERKLPLHTGDDKLYKTLHYDSMTAILVEAIKELSAKVEELENK